MMLLPILVLTNLLATGDTDELRTGNYCDKFNSHLLMLVRKKMVINLCSAIDKD